MKNYIVVLLFLVVGCNHIASDEDKFIKEIAGEDCSKNIAPVNSDLLVFLKMSDHKMIQTNKGYLCWLYYSKYRVQYDTFEKYIRAILSQRLVLDPINFSKENVIFNLDKDVAKTYSDKGILALLNQFCRKEENKYFFQGSSLLSLDKVQTFLLYCFNSCYKIYPSDALGGYWIYK